MNTARQCVNKSIFIQYEFNIYNKINQNIIKLIKYNMVMTFKRVYMNGYEGTWFYI